MAILLRTVRIFLVVVTSLIVGSSLVVAQIAATQDRQSDSAFNGIHRNRGINGRPDTVTINDGKTYERVTEQAYREQGYLPALEKLPTIIIQRIPVQPKQE